MVPALLAGCSSTKTLVPGQSVEVKRGDLHIVVSSDGSITTPSQFNLAFGTQGVVRDMMVKDEGTKVRAGALLATLDNDEQINKIKTALFGIQTARNNITLGCDTDHLPYNYPDLSISRMIEEAEKDMAQAASLYKEADYKDAGYWLVMTYFDIRVCEELIKSRPDVATLAGAKTNSIWSPDLYAGSLQPISANDQEVIHYLQNYEQDLIDVLNNIRNPEVSYTEISSQLERVKGKMSIASQMANSILTLKNRMVYKYPDTISSAQFVQSSLRFINGVQNELQNSVIDNDSYNNIIDNLYLAKVDLSIADDILENQQLIFESGGSINWKTLQQYNLSLQAAEISLYTAKLNIMKTAIISPIDGMIVSINLKENYSISAEEFSSKPAYGLVDTNISNMKFTGTVDEIDIMKVAKEQKATITVDAITGKTLTGTVQFISPYGAKSGSVIKFNVQIKLDPTDAPLRGGLTSTAEIMTASATNALLVPLSVIISTPGGSMVTVVKSDGTTEMRKVTLGLQNFEYAEVKSGLSEGEKVQVVTKQTLGTAVKTNTSSGSTMRALH